MSEGNLEKTVDSLIVTVNNLTKQVMASDIVVERLVASMDSHIREEKAMEETLKNISKSLQSLALQFAASPMERHKEVEIIIKPVHDKMRVLEKEVIDINAATEKRIMANAISHLSFMLVFIVALFAVAGYAYFNDKGSLIEKVTTTKELLKKDIVKNSEDINDNSEDIEMYLYKEHK